MEVSLPGDLRRGGDVHCVRACLRHSGLLAGELRTLADGDADSVRSFLDALADAIADLLRGSCHGLPRGALSVAKLAPPHAPPAVPSFVRA